MPNPNEHMLTGYRSPDLTRTVDGPTSRGTVRTVSARIAGEFQIPGHPARSSRYPADNDSAAPLPGEHNYAILVDLSGKSDEEIASLTTAGILQSKNV